MTHDQNLTLIVDRDDEDGTRTKTYTDHRSFLQDLKKYKNWAKRNGKRLEEVTETRLRIGDAGGPLFDQD